MSADGDQVGAVHHGDLLTLELSNAVTILSWWTWWRSGGWSIVIMLIIMKIIKVMKIDYNRILLQVDGSHQLVGVVSWGYGCAVVSTFGKDALNAETFANISWM